MTNINKEWAMALTQVEIDRVLSLGLYNHHAVLLFINLDEWWQGMFREDAPEEIGKEIFQTAFAPYYKMWLSTLYVVYEGTEACGVVDKKLTAIQDALHMPLLKRFRNATFHFQPNFSHDKHRGYVDRNSFSSARDLHERQGLVIRKMLRLLKHNPLLQNDIRHRMF